MYCARHKAIRLQCFVCSSTSLTPCEFCREQLKQQSAHCAACLVVSHRKKLLDQKIKQKQHRKPATRMHKLMVEYNNKLVSANNPHDCAMHAVAKANCKVCILAKSMMPNTTKASCSKHRSQTSCCGHCLRKRAFFKQRSKPKIILKAKPKDHFYKFRRNKRCGTILVAKHKGINCTAVT